MFKDGVVRSKGAAVTQTVAKWFGDIGAKEIIAVKTVWVGNLKIVANGTVILSDEDGGNVFGKFPLDVIDGGHVGTIDPPVILPVGKDIAVTTSGSSPSAFVLITCETFTTTP